MSDRDRYPDPTNEDRARWAAIGVREFQRVTGTDDESAVSDLLADLMHLADYLGEDWSSLLASAEMHHTAERAEEDNAPTYRVERVNQLGIGALGV